MKRHSLLSCLFSDDAGKEKETSYKRFDQFEQDEKRNTNDDIQQAKSPSSNRDKKPERSIKHIGDESNNPGQQDKSVTDQDKSVTDQDNSKYDNEKNNLLHLIEKLKMILKEWLIDTSFFDAGSSSEIPSKVTKPQNTDTDASFHMKALNFLSNNPEWVNEAHLSDNFKQKLKLKNDRMVSLLEILLVKSKQAILLPSCNVTGVFNIFFLQL